MTLLVPWDSITRTSDGRSPVTYQDIVDEWPEGATTVLPAMIGRYLESAIQQIDGPQGIGVAFRPGAQYQARLGNQWLGSIIGGVVEWPFSPIEGSAKISYRDSDNAQHELASVWVEDSRFIHCDADQPADIDSAYTLPVTIDVSVPTSYTPPIDLVGAVHDMVHDRLQLSIPIDNPSKFIQDVLGRYRRGSIIV